MIKWLDAQTVNILAVIAVLLVVAGLTVVLVDRSLYQVAVVILLAAITFAILTRKAENE